MFKEFIKKTESGNEIFYLIHVFCNMISRITLYVEKKVAEKAKLYAKETDRSLSEIIEEYLRRLTSDHPQKPEDLSPKLRSIIGVVKLPKNFNEEKAKRLHQKKNRAKFFSKGILNAHSHTLPFSHSHNLQNAYVC